MLFGSTKLVPIRLIKFHVFDCNDILQSWKRFATHTDIGPFVWQSLGPSMDILGLFYTLVSPSVVLTRISIGRHLAYLPCYFLLRKPYWSNLNCNTTSFKWGSNMEDTLGGARSLSFLVLYRLRHVTKILIKMHPLSTDGAILILVFANINGKAYRKIKCPWP